GRGRSYPHRTRRESGSAGRQRDRLDGSSDRIRREGNPSSARRAPATQAGIHPLEQSEPGASLTLEATQRAAEKAGLELTTVAISSREQIESGIAQTAQNRPDGLVVIHDTLMTGYRRQVAAAALKHGLPSI